MSAAKKRQAELDKPSSNRLSWLAERSMDSSWRAMEIQAFARAIGAAKFEVTCSSPDLKGKPVRRVYTAEQLRDPATIKSMSHMSARRFGVAIQPDLGSGVILVKGLDADGIKNLEAIGLSPAATVGVAGKFDAWIKTGTKITAEERTALIKRLESLTGVEQKHGGAGALVGFSSAQKAVSLTTCAGQVAPAARELLEEVRASIFEAKAKVELAKIAAAELAEQKLVEAKALAQQAQAAKLLAAAIEKNVTVKDGDFDDVGGIKHLHKGWLQSACTRALGDQSLFLVSLSVKFEPAQVERGVIAAMARQGVTAEQAYRAVYEGSSVFAGKDLEAAQFVTDGYVRVAFEDEKRSLDGVDVRAEARKLYPDLLKYAERGTDSELKALDAKGRQEGMEEQQRLDDQAEQHRLEVAERIAAEALLTAEGETYD